MARRDRIVYEPDLKGIGELLKSAQMEAMVRAAAEKGATFAESIAPRRSGRYARSFRLTSTRNGGPRQDRAEARVVNEADYWWAIEYINGERVLGRMVDYIEQNGP